MRKYNPRSLHIIFLFLIIGLSSCGPKTINTDPREFSLESLSWIPFTGNEEITFFHLDQDNDSLFLTFTGQGKETYFENVRYMSDQSGFITLQKDYYANLERQELYFESPGTPFSLKYYLEKDLGETGEWDILSVQIADNEYYSNEMNVVIFETDNYNKGETYKQKASINLNGVVFKNVYYWTQNRRPYELYYTKSQGIVGFKISSNELWAVLE